MPGGDVVVLVWSWNIIINVAASFHVTKQRQELLLKRAVMSGLGVGLLLITYYFLFIFRFCCCSARLRGTKQLRFRELKDLGS